MAKETRTPPRLEQLAMDFKRLRAEFEQVLQDEQRFPVLARRANQQDEEESSKFFREHPGAEYHEVQAEHLRRLSELPARKELTDLYSKRQKTLSEIWQAIMEAPRAVQRDAVHHPEHRYVFEQLKNYRDQPPTPEMLDEIASLLEELSSPSTDGSKPVEDHASPGPGSEPAATTAGREREELLKNKDRVTYPTAAKYLGVGLRQIRKLVAQGNLDTVGEGSHKKITASSLRKRVGI